MSTPVYRLCQGMRSISDASQHTRAVELGILYRKVIELGRRFVSCPRMELPSPAAIRR
jgi:hypothetical protein